MSAGYEQAGAGKGCKVTALVLAGARRGVDEVAQAAGVPTKALAAVAGIPMALRVLNALQASRRIDGITLCGPDPAALESCPQLQDFIERQGVTCVPARAEIGDSVQAGLAAIDPEATALVTSADHALLDADIIDHFLERVSVQGAGPDSGAAVSVALTRYALLRAAWPEARRTALRFAEGDYCGCNLYALSGARARDVVSLWQRAQAERKRPWRMLLHLFGLRALASYAAGRLGMEQVRQAALQSTGVTLNFVELPFPHAGIDVDTPEDLILVERILSERQCPLPPGTEGSQPSTRAARKWTERPRSRDS